MRRYTVSLARGFLVCPPLHRLPSGLLQPSLLALVGVSLHRGVNSVEVLFNLSGHTVLLCTVLLRIRKPNPSDFNKKGSHWIL